VGSVNYMQDVMISPHLLRQIGDAYRRIRNTFKFLLGNLVDYDPAHDALAPDALLPLDRYILHRLEEIRAQVTDAYERYEFYRAFHLLYNFCTLDLSALYCDIVKDRLYVELADGPKRRACQTALHEVLDTLTRLLAPIMAFTCDEVWEHVRALDDSAGEPWSVHLADWPMARPERTDNTLAGEYAGLLAVRADVMRELEKCRKDGMIGAGLEAAVVLHSSDAALSALLQEYAEELPAFFIVSQVQVAPEVIANGIVGEDTASLTLRIEQAAGAKCARCWNFSPSVGTIAGHADLCARCHAVMQAAGQV
jgi:isoleucyl-tRNA synthetase